MAVTKPCVIARFDRLLRYDIESEKSGGKPVETSNPLAKLVPSDRRDQHRRAKANTREGAFA
jgi:hypothetical protein